jgi:hypothetical protein
VMRESRRTHADPPLGAATQSTVSGIADAQNGEIWLLSPTPMISS